MHQISSSKLKLKTEFHVAVNNIREVLFMVMTSGLLVIW